MRINIAILTTIAVGCGYLDAVAAGQFAVGPDKEYTTISAALAEMTDDSVCVITEGTYRETIHVTLNHVTLRGEGCVVITGCDEAAELQPCEINGRNGLKTAVKGPVYDAFQGRQYLSPARYPDKTSPMTSNMDWEESVIRPDGTIDFAGHAQERFSDLHDGYYVGLHGRAGGAKLSSWYSLTLPIAGVGENGYIEVNQDEASSGFMGKYGQDAGLGYIIGARAVLDAPGEWYCDGNEWVLIPPAEGSGDYALRTRLYGAVISGNGVRLENIRFKAATAHVDGDDVTLKQCAFDYISPFQHNPNDQPKNKTGQSQASCWGLPENGTAGVYVSGDRFVAEDCRFARSWWCGMMVRGNEARIENCLFEDMNWMAKRCAGLFSWGDGNVVRHCTFRNLGAAAIEGGNAAWVEQYAKNNVWEYNYIEDVCKLTVDQGFFYVNHQSGANPKANSVWRYNVGRGARGPEKGDWTETTVGYYVDNSSSGYRVHHNIAIDAHEAARYNDTQEGPLAGKDIWYYNNTFYKCDEVAFSFWGSNKEVKAQADAEVMFINNVVIAGKGSFDEGTKRLQWKNNFDALPASALENPDVMDFTPVDETLRTGGIPVEGQAIPYVGAVDPEKGMWRYGADESRLPAPSAGAGVSTPPPSKSPWCSTRAKR